MRLCESLRAEVDAAKPKAQEMLKNLRPWSELLAVSKPATADAVKTAVPVNLARFQANYITVGAGAQAS